MNVIDLNHGKVESVAAMKQERSGHSSVLLNDSIYVAGGKNNKTILDTVERFDLRESQWYPCKPMTEKRSLFSLVCVANNLYAIGGVNNGAMHTAEKYDPVADKWTTIESMSTPRVAAAAVVLNDCIYIIGGSTKSVKGSDTASVVCFDTRIQKWSVVGELSEARDFISAVAIDHNRILAVGGFDSTTKACKIVEIYDSIEDKWCRVEDMDTASAGGLIFTV